MLSEKMLRNGENLWNALEVTAIAWKETNSMLNEVWDKLHQQIPFKIDYYFQDRKELHEELSDEYVYPSKLIQGGLVPKGKGRRKPIGWLAITAVIGAGSNCDGIFGSIPYVCVEYAQGEYAWDEIYRADDPKSWDNDTVLKASGRLVTSKDSPILFTKEDCYWSFCLPLFTLDSSDAIQRKIVDPILCLLKEADVSQVSRLLNDAFMFEINDSKIVLAKPNQIQAVNSNM